MKRAWLFVLPLIAAFLVGGASPGQAAAPSWTIGTINNHGCAAGNWALDARFSGMPNGGYFAHTVVTSGGEVYMNEKIENMGDYHGSWFLTGQNSYGPITHAWPMPSGQPFKAVFTLEKPLGNVVWSWTLVAKSCDSTALLWNGKSAEDADGGYVSVYQDRCPALASSRANGCPVWPRTLSLAAKTGPKRVAGQLLAPGHTTFSAGRTVVVWKVRPGPDLKVGTRTTGAAGGFSVPVGPGQYYATTPGLLQPKYGQVYAKKSAAVTVK